MCAPSDAPAPCACAQLHAQHRDGIDLTAALRAAEAAVKEELGYTIALLEKPLYDPDGALDAAAGAPADESINDDFMDRVEAQQQQATADGGD